MSARQAGYVFGQVGGCALFKAGQPETEPPAEVQIFSEGEWVTHPTGKFKMTPAIFDELIANRAATKDDPPVDIEHRSALFLDDSPAEGWVKGLRKAPDPADPSKQALFGAVEWTDVGRAHVLAKHYRYASGGVYLKDRDRKTGDPIGARLDHLALVKKPFIQGMQPLTFNFPGPGRADGGEDTMNDLHEYLRKLLKAPADADESALLARARQLETGIATVVAGRGAAALRLSAKAMECLTLGADAPIEEISAAILELAARASVGTELAGRVAKLEGEKLVGEVDAAIASFKVTPAERDSMLRLAQKDAELFREIVGKREARRPGGDPLVLAGKGRSSTKRSQQNKAISEYQAEHKDSSYTQALIACAAQQPDLFQETAGEEA